MVLLGILLGLLLWKLTELLWKRSSRRMTPTKKNVACSSLSSSSIMSDYDNSLLKLNDHNSGMVLKDNKTTLVMYNDNPVLVWSDDLVWEIFVRLPTKALMRFKCVSKNWNSTIQHPLFTKAYNTRCLAGLLIAKVPCYYRLHEVEGIAERFYASCFDSDNEKRNVQAYSYPVAVDGEFMTAARKLYFTNIAKGLFGLYNKFGAFKLCNIATHELLDVPTTSLYETIVSWGVSIKCDYYLGFEPLREVYKLLRFCYIGSCDDAYLQICTLEGGGNHLDWRDLGPVPQLARTYSMHKTCINEILYLMGWKYTDNKWNRRLVVFNLSTETTSETIRLPISAASSVETIELVRIGGRPALISLAYEIMGKIWILNDNETWTEIISVDLLGMIDLTCAGNLPTGELLLAQKTNGKDPLPIYKYDHRQNKLMKWIEVDLCFSSTGPGHWSEHFWKICYYEDNILPLNCLVRRQ